MSSCSCNVPTPTNLLPSVIKSVIHDLAAPVAQYLGAIDTNLCLGSKEAVQERVGKFLAGLASRRDEVRRRCRTILQSRAESLLRDSHPDSGHTPNAHPTLALV